MNKKLILLLILGIFGTITLFSSARVYAQTPAGKYPSIIQKLVQKFGLNESEVQSVFDEDRKEHQAEMKTRFEDRLAQEVKDGKLTEAQKQLIIAKHNELQAKHEADRPENWQSLTREERKTKMETERQDLEAWANANGIDIKYLFGGFGPKGFGRGR